MRELDQPALLRAMQVYNCMVEDADNMWAQPEALQFAIRAYLDATAPSRAPGGCVTDKLDTLVQTYETALEEAEWELGPEDAALVASLRSDIARLAASHAGDRERWRPMSEAPQDQRILAVVESSMFDDDVVQNVRIVAWGKTSHVPIYGWCLADQGVEDFDICKPVGWMPLPLSPAAGQDEAKEAGRG